jgi:hypothetical protein
MTQFIRLTVDHNSQPILVNVAQITNIMPADAYGTAVALDDGGEVIVRESFDVIEANLRLMAYITDMEATA